MNKIWFSKRNKGVSMIEGLLYISILVVIIFVLVDVGEIMTRVLAELNASRSMKNTSIVTLSRMLFEVRAAESVNIGASTLGSHPGMLVVESSATTTEFYLEDGALKLRQDSVDMGSLTPPEIDVTNLVFHHIDTGISEGVRIELELTSNNQRVSSIKRFFTSALLRNSYVGS